MDQAKKKKSREKGLRRANSHSHGLRYKSSTIDKLRQSVSHARRNTVVKLEGPSFDEGDRVDLTHRITRLHPPKPEVPTLFDGAEDKDFFCKAAKTALLIPFKWAEPDNAHVVMEGWIDDMCKRKIVDKDGLETLLWEETWVLPEQVTELDPHFRQTLGVFDNDENPERFKGSGLSDNDYEETEIETDEEKIGGEKSGQEELSGRADPSEKEEKGKSRKFFEVESDEVCRHLIVREKALRVLFPSPSLVATDKIQKVRAEVTIEKVEITMFPLGTGMLVYHINWIPSVHHPYCNNSSSSQNLRANPSPESSSFQHQSHSQSHSLSPSFMSSPNLVPSSTSTTSSNTSASSSRSSLPSLSQSSVSITIDDLRTWLYLAKFRHEIPSVVEGWVLAIKKEDHSASESQKKCLGDRLYNSLSKCQPISLTHISNFILMGSKDDPNNTRNLLGRFNKRAYHQTVVVVDREPPPEKLAEFLFHLRRAYGQLNKPPPDEEIQSTDYVLRPRYNREGTVSLSWLKSTKTSVQLPGDGTSGKEDIRIAHDDKVNSEWEVRRWPEIFQGIFLLLSVHVHGEKSILRELSNTSAHASTLLTKIFVGGEGVGGISKEGGGGGFGGAGESMGANLLDDRVTKKKSTGMVELNDDDDLEQLQSSWFSCCSENEDSLRRRHYKPIASAPVNSKIPPPENGLAELRGLRRELLSLATLMTRFTLQMSNDDCGGLSEYIEFFTYLRKIFRIRNQREELRGEIQDVLSLVESSYLEEQRKYAEYEKMVTLEKKKLSKKKDELKKTKQARFERVVAVLSIVVLPTVVVAGVFGMNLQDLPHVSFWPLMLTTLALSILLLIIFIVISWERVNHNKEKQIRMSYGYYGTLPYHVRVKMRGSQPNVV